MKLKLDSTKTIGRISLVVLVLVGIMFVNTYVGAKRQSLIGFTKK